MFREFQNRLKQGILRLTERIPQEINPYDDADIRFAISDPQGSHDLLVAYALILDAYESGRLSEGSNAIAATRSGGFGVALAALLCSLRVHLRLIVQGEPTFTMLSRLRMYKNVEFLLHYGSESAMERARCEAERDTSLVLIDHCANPAAWKVHAQYTAPALMRLAGGEIHSMYMPLGTCATVCGLHAFLKQRHTGTRIVGVTVDTDHGIHIPGVRSGSEINNDVRHPWRGSCKVVEVTYSAAMDVCRKLGAFDRTWPGLGAAAALHAAIDSVQTRRRDAFGRKIIIYAPDSAFECSETLAAERQPTPFAPPGF